MRCPYLREHRVHRCGLASERLLIPIADESQGDPRCVSQRYLDCPLMRGRSAPEVPAARCPHLHEGLAETCVADPYRRMVLLSDDMLSRCHSSAHTACPSYLALSSELHNEGCTR